MMWDAFQREVLGAMGHTLLVPVAVQAVEAQAVAAQSAETAVPTRQRARGADGDSQPALLRALALAAGVDATHVDIMQLLDVRPLAELRTPIAKRRLWPRLRALRKTTPT